ncbi:GntR family transcriptional regulator [Halobacillus shinanisalinarum]|uniref:GntR family transcriptional regulator n=1 Tax=Halobacillus shinanisalinarum TaxID=2932258 RepID=A0ABY4H354_9BACI|nr:GntR family transcriptional regulator [Halobacillus shinanisalinarum]UOQ94886.1 GntR family transcriptional regulator [Halobacillus shinanisalinarum]
MSKHLNLKLEDRNTLHLKVCNVLRKAILQGDFEPGERLIQSELAESLDVSRMPIREALRKLESEGLVKLEPHRGAIVKPMNIEDIKEIYQLRANLEKLAVELSVPDLTEGDKHELKTLMEEMENTEDPEVFVEANISFHQLLIKRCTWGRLLSFIETLWNGFPQQTPTLLPGQMKLSNQEHQQIFEAVNAKNESKSATLVSEHIKRTGEALVNSLG